MLTVFSSGTAFLGTHDLACICSSVHAFASVSACLSELHLVLNWAQGKNLKTSRLQSSKICKSGPIVNAQVRQRNTGEPQESVHQTPRIITIGIPSIILRISTRMFEKDNDNGEEQLSEEDEDNKEVDATTKEDKRAR